MTTRTRGSSFTAATLVFVGTAALLAAGCGETAPTLVPPFSINALMVTTVDNASHVLWDVEDPALAPKDEADWLELENHAIQVAAAGTLIQLGGTGQADLGWIRQVGWRENAEALSAAGMKALAAAKARNLDALIEVNGVLVETCLGCHKAFKPELPSEGIVHQRPHSESHAK